MAEDKKERKPFRKLENFDGFIESLYRPNRSAAPFYSNSADYNTNSKSYYDDLSRKAKLFEILAHRIWEYDEELAKRFEEWDALIERFPEDVEKLLIEWLRDGTLDDIINKNIFADLNKDINSLKLAIIEIKKYDAKQDENINKVDNRLSTTERALNDRLDNIISPSPIDIVETVTELNNKYPNGAKGVVVVKEDGHYYYYQENKWLKGGEYISPITYPLVKNTGYPTNLNLEDSWVKNADITTLKTGYYTAFLQSKNINSNYPVTKNIPNEIDGRECLIKVYQYGLNSEDRRTDFEIIENSTSDIYRTSLNAEGKLLEWGSVLKFRESRPLQQYRLTSYGGEIFSLTTADARNDGNKLNIPVNELPTGFFYGQILESTIDRLLPDDILYSAYYHFVVYRNYDGRVSITLHDNSSKRTWQSYSLPNAKELVWNRLDTETDLLEHEINVFSYKANQIINNNLKTLVITDTHIQHEANTNQIANINASNIEDFYKIDESLVYSDAGIHLGDWVDGNFKKDNTANSMVKLSREFYSKSNRYGVYGNHDFNGQWDGFSGQNGQYKYSLLRLFNRDELKTHYTPVQKDYYYIDNKDKKVRMLFVNSFDISYKLKDNGDLYLDPLNTRGFGNEQIKWILETLNTVPSDYNVVIYSHDTFNNVFDDGQYYNGDLVRKICEAYQDKKELEVFTTGIDETSPVYDYYKIEDEHNFENSNGKILGVISGHRHIDKSINKNGIRYVSLLCARAESGSTISKPKRNYYDVSRNAISYIEFDLPNEKINILRYGAGAKKQTYKMFE